MQSVNYVVGTHWICCDIRYVVGTHFNSLMDGEVILMSTHYMFLWRNAMVAVYVPLTTRSWRPDLGL